MAVISAKIKNKRGEERIVSLKAYDFMRKSYTLLGYVDENGNDAEGPTPSGNVKKKDVAPVAAKRGRPVTKTA